MYIPDCFRLLDKNTMLKFIENFSFGTLVTTNNGTIIVNNYPFLVESSYNKLFFHASRANEQARFINNQTDFLVVFSECNHYISPSWYNNQKYVPTCNYISVQVKGIIKIICDENEMLLMLDKLTNKYESIFNGNWSSSNISSNTINEMLKEIICFQIDITNLEGKAKLSQNKNRSDRLGIINRLEAIGSHQSQQMANLMRSELDGNLDFHR